MVARKTTETKTTVKKSTEAKTPAKKVTKKPEVKEVAPKTRAKKKFDSPKEQATYNKEPWVGVLNTHVNKDNIRNGFFELDWNEHFVLKLKQEGYGFDGDADEEIGYTYLKFVIATEEDAEEALETVDIYRENGFRGPIYLMPVGGVESVYTLNNRRVAELAMKHGFRYSDRLQVPLFKNEWGT